MKSKTRKAAGKASLDPLVRPDWTSNGTGCNNSVQYLETVSIVESMIRNDAHMLLSGRADQTARLIVSTLAHNHGFGPNGERLPPQRSGGRQHALVGSSGGTE